MSNPLTLLCLGLDNLLGISYVTLWGGKTPYRKSKMSLIFRRYIARRTSAPPYDAQNECHPRVK